MNETKSRHHPRVAVERLDASPRKKEKRRTRRFLGPGRAYACQSRKTANAGWKKSACAKRASRPRTSSLRSESSLSLSRRFSASISCAASSAISNANASHYRANAPRASVSFPVVSCVPWIGMENGKRLVTRRDVFSFGRAGGEAPAGLEGGDARAAMAGRRRRAPREPGAVEPWFATPRHAPGRVAGRPHSPREALKTTTRTRANE